MKPRISDLVLKAEPPWIYMCLASLPSVDTLALQASLSPTVNIVLRWVRGQKMRTCETLFNEFAAAFQFPYYFGENWNAFDECITDLEWIEAKGYLLIIHNSHELLVDTEDPSEELQHLLKKLEWAGEEWAAPIRQGSPDRQAKPFHVILHVDVEKESEFRHRLTRAGMSIPEVSLNS